jgi:putative aminopeptidase FrvX
LNISSKYLPKFGNTQPYFSSAKINQDGGDMTAYVELLQTLSDGFGPPGGEGPVARLVEQYVQSFCQLSRDGLGSVLAEKAGKPRPRLMLAAHLDEIGFMVQGVTAQGYLRLQALGGWEPAWLPGQRLIIQTAAGPWEGVVAATPIHFKKEKHKEVKVEDLLVDIGAADAAAVGAMGVGLGDLAVPRSGFAVLHDTILLNKAWDDRVGVAAMIAVLQRFQDRVHPNTIIGAGTVQEEVGSRGAACAVEAAKPDLAIVLEGPPADDQPGVTSDPPQGALGKGVQIRLFDPSIIVPQKLWRWVVELAGQRRIPYQLAVRRSGATDARAIHLAHGGIPTIILGVPVRYAHSAAGMIQYQDFAAMVDLTAAIVEELDEGRLAVLTA